MNNVVLIGRLTKDADLRYTNNGIATANFTLAVERAFSNASGEKETDFINCVVWRKPAETLSSYTKKGSKIAVRGRMQTRNYENKQGQKVYVTEVVVEEFTFLDSKKNSEDNSYQNSKPADPFESSGQSIELSESDMPF